MIELSGLSGKYGCIFADPAWKQSGNSVENPGRNPRRHYRTMTLSEIEAMPVKQYAADNCVLFFWITGPHLVIGSHIPIMKAWGFKPSAMGFDWIKLNPNAPGSFFTEADFKVGLGHTTLKNAEYCLIGKRGLSMRVEPVRALVIDHVREHSRKPDCIRDRIRTYVGPDVRVAELFARSSPNDANWDVWGDEKDKYDVT